VTGLALNSPLHLQNVYHQLAELGRMGCPYHVVLADDAARMDLTPYRLALLLLCPRRDAQLSALVARLRSAGLSLVSWPGTGLIADHGFDPAGASAIVGIPLSIPDPAPTTIQGGGSDGTYGATAPLSHRLMATTVLTITPPGARLLMPSPPSLRSRVGCWPISPAAPAATCGTPAAPWSGPSRNLVAIHADAAGSYVVTLPAGWTVVRPVLAPRHWSFSNGILTAQIDQHDTSVFVRSDR